VVESGAIGAQEARADALARFTYPPTTAAAMNRVSAANPIEKNIESPVANANAVKPAR
jgi:hypothetical protein